ncbi:MAG: DUF5330 domain-containing protein [Hyphomicrobiaceae bacterium]|nr:DUF5330 domain-containing protein [Hyphomicrobiaceae bacterium]
MFLVRCALWLTLVVALVPLDAESRTRVDGPSALETLAAARLAAEDLGGFCARQPDVCETGRSVAAILREKARTGVAMISDWLDPPSGADTLSEADRQIAHRMPNPA